MAEKPQARGMPIPRGRTVPDESPDAVLFTESEAIEPEMDDKLPPPTPDEEKQLDMAVGAIKDFIWDEGYEEIVSRLEGEQGNIEQAIGTMAGRMINREVMASDEGGNSISRDLLFAIGGEVVNELYNVAENAGLYQKGSEQEDQEAQGQSLIYAAQKYMEMGDDQVDPSGPMKLAANAIRGKQAPEEMVSKMGVPVPEEPMDMEAV
jgi:hypothetical protein|tara:strand:- start:153 stop:773 length:621 start_codon:yes stop_codon:yes gene_type:complete